MPILNANRKSLDRKPFQDPNWAVGVTWEIRKGIESMAKVGPELGLPPDGGWGWMIWLAVSLLPSAPGQ